MRLVDIKCAVPEFYSAIQPFSFFISITKCLSGGIAYTEHNISKYVSQRNLEIVRSFIVTSISECI